MTFHLDTSGAVILDEATHDAVVWEFLSPFQQGAEGEARRELAERLMREGMTADQAREVTAFLRWHPSALQRIMADCDRYRDRWPARQVYDFASGAAFWTLQQQNTFLGFPPLTISIAEDALIYVSEAA